MKKLRHFSLKIKDQELGVFDVLEHHIDILDILANHAIETHNITDLQIIADRMLDASDRYMTVVLGLEEPINYDGAEPKQRFGFNHNQVESVSEEDGQPREL